MEIRRFNNQSSRESSKQKKMTVVESRRKPVGAPDLTDFMNDMFFGTVKSSDDQKKAYNLTGTDQAVGVKDRDKDEDLDEDSSRRSTSSRLTEEWLDEARRLVASSPSRCDSPSRLVGSPRFAAAAQGTPFSASFLDRRDPLSRSARRHRTVESFSGEIISKSAGHSRNKSESFNTRDAPDSSPSELSPAAAVHKWFSNILKPPNPDTPTPPPPPPPPPPPQQLPPPTLPRRQSLPRKSRFQADSCSTLPQAISTPQTGRNSDGPNLLTDPNLLSPPKNLIESAHRRSIRSSTCFAEKPAPRPSPNGPSSSDLGVNGFLREQRTKLRKLTNGGNGAKAKIVLSGTSNSTSSMVAAICYAWLLENRARKEEDEEESVILPVMNLKRGRMWKLRQASWLFHHTGLDVASLVFSDEVDLEGLMMAGKLTVLVIGKDVLRINGEVGSQCTILTDNYCEDAYDLLQTPVLKKLLLAGILLDTQNLNSSGQLSMTRDAEAVQLLLVGSTPNYRNTLFDQLMQDQRDDSFLEALRENYGKPPNGNGHESEQHVERRISERKSPSIRHPEAAIQNSDTRVNSKTNRVSPNSAKPSSSLPQGTSEPQTKTTADASRGKNKFFLAKWFGFGSK